MSPEILITLTAATGVAAAMVGGVFFAFSTFVMAGLGRAGPEAGTKAMQQINITVINPLVFLFFLGTAALGAVVAALSLFSTTAGPLTTFGAALYIIGCIGVTGTRNVPLNEALARVDAGTAEADAVWADYLRRWTYWNHVRTLACIGSAGLTIAGALQM